MLGRTLLHAVVVGGAAGLVGAMFFAGVEVVQHFMLEQIAGYTPLRAAGEKVTELRQTGEFRPWVLFLLPAIGALGGGILSRFAPETAGGGADATIEAFHTGGGIVRRRVPLIKMFASIFTLGFGGSGGREGPTMQIGGAIGSLMGSWLRVPKRERRVLLVAGMAAGMSAVFRTPLGAALLAVEVLHRDDFEAEALIPSIIASVTAYSVFISIFGEQRLFDHSSSYPFTPTHLPLYLLLAVVVSAVGSMFEWMLHEVKRKTQRSSLPLWIRPAVGGLVVGAAATLIIMFVHLRVGAAGMGLGILGGGYGAAQIAILPASWMPDGWRAVELLAVLGLGKMIATALTVGTGGSAGDFGPSLVIGGLFGGAFGRAAAILFPQLHIDPGAFALVGMGTMYGGLAHVPVASLVMVCELTGSYDLLVPLMLAGGVSFLLLRNFSLYPAQRAARRRTMKFVHAKAVPDKRSRYRSVPD